MQYAGIDETLISMMFCEFVRQSFFVDYKAMLHIHYVVEEYETDELSEEIGMKRKKEPHPMKRSKRKPLFVKEWCVC